jgi:hypothetical protein
VLYLTFDINILAPSVGTTWSRVPAITNVFDTSHGEYADDSKKYD